MVDTLGTSRGFIPHAFVDEDGISYGIKHTEGAIHVVNKGALVPGFAIPEYDEIVLSYTSGDLTGVVYKLATVTVGTLTLSYTDGNLTGVVKS